MKSFKLKHTIIFLNPPYSKTSLKSVKKQFESCVLALLKNCLTFLVEQINQLKSKLRKIKHFRYQSVKFITKKSKGFLAYH